MVFYISGSRVSHPCRPGEYSEEISNLNTGDIKFPIESKDIAKLEKLNDIRINVFGYDYSPDQPADKVLNTGN